MAKLAPMVITLTAPTGPAGQSVTQTFNNVTDFEIDMNNVNNPRMIITDGPNKYYFDYAPINTVVVTISAAGVTSVVIST